MKPVEAVMQRGWEAGLKLAFQRRGDRTVLARRSSFGPLAVQKALYPEGELVCHAILLHPPGGIAGGDRLEIAIDVETGAHALLTTPGATKWYRSAATEASQSIGISIGRKAVCEWMPQENIFFNAARTQNALSVDLQEGAVFCGWDVMCLGRTASGERFQTGRIHQHLRLTRGTKPLFEELGTLEGGGTLLDSPIGMAGYPICATFIMAGVASGRDALDFCRAVVPPGDCKSGVSAMGDVLVARCLARTSEAARAYFLKMWEHLRPKYAQVPARVPRIWAT
ncbi:MAG TPA: urease accessory protein UreD [Burkholderiales bacterium]